MTKVLVLGGGGAMAQVTIRDLLRSGVDKVGVADINLPKARTTAEALHDDRAVALVVDARDGAKLAAGMRDWDVVVNSTWYEFNLFVMRAAISAGVHYLDLGGLYHMTLRQLRLSGLAEDAGVTCVLGMGSTPGTMNVMGAYAASRMDRLDSMLLRSGNAVVSGKVASFQPPYSIRTLLDEFTLPPVILQDGKIREVMPLSGFEAFTLPDPVGRVEGYYTLHSELATMPFTMGKGLRNMNFIVAFPEESKITETMATLVRLGLASKEPLDVKGQTVTPYEVSASAIDKLPKPAEAALDVDIQRVEAHGEIGGEKCVLRVDSVDMPNREWMIDGGTVGTGTPPSIIAQWLAAGKIRKRGVLPPESCVDPEEFFKALEPRGIHVTKSTL